MSSKETKEGRFKLYLLHILRPFAASVKVVVACLGGNLVKEDGAQVFGFS